jgi:uncharacterized protein YjbI with pentapeptide repeats
MQYDATNRFTGAVQFTAEIECADDAPRSLKLGLAVRWAIGTHADLVGADLARANLAGADLAGANLAGANGISGRIIDGGLRSDGYRFLLTRTEPGAWRIKSGCRNYTVDKARAHWAATRAGTPLGEETFAIIDHMTRLAAIREWPAEGESPRTDAA